MAQKHNISDTEYPMTRMGTIQQPSRRYRRLRHPSFTAAIWTANNPLLQRGEFGSEIDTGKLKVGDGVTYWNDLGYVAASQIDFADITGSPDDNVALKNALDAKQDVLTEGTGIDIDSDNIISNTGVRSVATGTTNGTISVNTGGTSAEVAVYGLGSAAYTSSGDYATAAQGVLASTAVQPGDLATVATSGAFSDLTGKPTTLSGYGITDGANTSLSNLTNTGANISNWSSNVSNCITEIPQDIKLELSGGTLTLKAGSKVYVPNGSGVFNAVTIASDLTATDTNNVQFMVFYKGNTLQRMRLDKCFSGASAPTGFGTNAVWYDTTNNQIKRTTDSGSTWSTDNSFPIAVCTSSSSAISSIDQVFNGFGYIGSTVFALPGTTQLIPNRFNADGTLNNTKLTANTVQIRTLTVTVSNAVLAARFNAGAPFGITSDAKYDESRNINTSAGVDWNYGFIGTISTSSGKITSLTTKQVFHAVDYSDTEFIANQAGPSNRYVDLTLPSSGQTFTAPADGYISFAKTAQATEYISLINYTNGMSITSSPSVNGNNARLFIRVSKGDVINLSYNASGTTVYFRFIYANGAK